MINERIKSARKLAALSLREASHKVGISAQAIHKYEKGYTPADSTMLVKFSTAYGVPVDYFLRQPVNLEITAMNFHKVKC